MSEQPAADARATLERESDVTFFIASGPGGQHRNRNATGVRLLHRPSGIVVTATERRSQAANLEVAYARLARRLEAARRGLQPPGVRSAPETLIPLANCLGAPHAGRLMPLANTGKPATRTRLTGEPLSPAVSTLRHTQYKWVRRTFSGRWIVAIAPSHWDGMPLCVEVARWGLLAHFPKLYVTPSISLRLVRFSILVYTLI